MDSLPKLLFWAAPQKLVQPKWESPGRVSPGGDRLPVIDTKGRIMRGKSFNSHQTDVRSADRGSDAPNDQDSSLGFRLTRTIR